VSDEAYYNEIEAHFALRRGTPFVVSAKDWALMKKRQADGVPLPVVIEAIDSVFEKNETSGRRKVISSLSYCRHAVKELWEERRELYVGEGDETPEESPVAALEALAVQVPAEFGERVRALAREQSVPRIEEKLIELEHEMLESLVASLPDAGALREEAARSLGEVARLDEKTRARSIEANLRRLVRERFGLPRLSLFR
jgi:hypothetical protein